MTADPPPDRCGTTAGYQRHQDNGTPSCQPCRDAQADWQRHYRTRMYLAGGPMLIDSTGTRRRLQALVRMGWTFDHLAERLGVKGPAVRAWTYNATVRRTTAARVAAVYDQLWDKRGPSDKTSARAQTKGWPPPLAWDDATIDSPDARPAPDVDGRPHLDEIAIQRAMRGRPPEVLTRAERLEVVRRLSDQRFSAREIAERLGVHRRQVDRDRADLEWTAA